MKSLNGMVCSLTPKQLWITPFVPILPLLYLALVLLSHRATGQGVMINGGNHDAIISAAGETDSWTFTADAGDSVILRIGTIGFTPRIRLLGPGGVLVRDAFVQDSLNRDIPVFYQPTNSGTF